MAAHVADSAASSVANTSVLFGLDMGPPAGQGTTGMVYPVLHAIDGGRYVVKKVPAAFPTGRPLGDEVVLEEVRLHRLCSAQCSAIVRYVFACESSEALLVLMEACDAVLWDALTNTAHWSALNPASLSCGSSGWPSLLERCAWSSDLCRAVEHCHSLLVLHRDVNPWNIFLAREPERVARSKGAEQACLSLRLGDFGLAVQLKDLSEELEGIEAGGRGVALDASALSSLYSAPELGKRYGFAADVFSLGMTLFALWTATGCSTEDALIDRVVAAKNACVLDENCKSSHQETMPSPVGRSSVQHAPPQLQHLILLLLRPGPADRPSAAEASTAARASLPRTNCQGKQEGMVDAVQAIERAFHKHVASGTEKVPRETLWNLFSNLSRGNDGETAKLLAAAETALGWDPSDMLVDYRQFLTWVFQT